MTAKKEPPHVGDDGRVTGSISLWGVTIPAQFLLDLARSLGVQAIGQLALIGYLAFHLVPRIDAITLLGATLQVSDKVTSERLDAMDKHVQALDGRVADLATDVAEARGAARRP